MQVTGQRRAIATRNPQVRGTGVEDNLERLARSAQLYLGEVLGIEIVGQRSVVSRGCTLVRTLAERDNLLVILLGGDKLIFDVVFRRHTFSSHRGFFYSRGFGGTFVVVPFVPLQEQRAIKGHRAHGSQKVAELGPPEIPRCVTTTKRILTCCQRHRVAQVAQKRAYDKLGGNATRRFEFVIGQYLRKSGADIQESATPGQDGSHLMDGECD
ncbi:hypothetical protein OGATHE_001800 [Ogataea polymorpha]|uniref:Uncharacterized protein n=1 Tax=Ogataea polymorpha TaxID=460523 RepID=A0A9P8TCU2_9ASCO|nr:hypothetical protein OGATHE_001800 [Ogataea polymorpha]